MTKKTNIVRKTTSVTQRKTNSEKTVCVQIERDSDYRLLYTICMYVCLGIYIYTIILY